MMAKKRKHVKTARVDWWVMILGVLVVLLVLIVFRVAQSALGDEPGMGGGKKENEPNWGNSNNFVPTQAVTIWITPTPTSNIQTQQVILPTEAPIVEPTQITSQPTAQPTTETVVTQTTQSNMPVMKQPEIKSVPISGKAAISSPGQLMITPKAGSGSILEAIKEGIQSIGRGEVVTPAVTPIIIPTPKATTKKEIELLLNTVTLKYQIKGGQLALVSQDSQGSQVAIEEVDLRRTETAVLNRLEKRGIALSLTSDNKLAVRNNEVTAVTDLPIMVDVETKTLMISTPSGPKPVTVLPDKALENILDLGVIASVNTQEIPKIEYLGGELAYRFGGIKKYKMFGFYEVTVPTSIVVSAETGEVVSSDQPLVTKIVRLISI